MMDKKVYDLLKHIGNVYPTKAPQNVEIPFVLYQKISQNYKHDMEGRDTLEHSRFQIDIYAYSLSTCKELCARVREAFDLKAFEVSYFGDYEDETKFHRISLDFEIWEDQI